MREDRWRTVGTAELRPLTICIYTFFSLHPYRPIRETSSIWVTASHRRRCGSPRVKQFRIPNDRIVDQSAARRHSRASSHAPKSKGIAGSGQEGNVREMIDDDEGIQPKTNVGSRKERR